MTDDEFFERLRDDAAPLRYEPDTVAATRMAARIRARIDARPTVAQLLASWFRPLGATLAAIALAATIGISIANNRTDEAATLSAYTSTGIDVSMAGDSYRVAD